MTDREAFEAWDKEVFALPDRYYAPLYKGDFPSIDVKARYQAWQAAIAHSTQQERKPAWHDAPTVPGLWLCTEDERDPRDWVCWPIEYPEKLVGVEDQRWYGPIPKDAK